VTEPNDASTSAFEVVVNDEGQYSIWSADRDRPLGWYSADFTGTEEECLSRIDEVWTDMRPRSLRERRM
jgi:MbtH protein